MDGFRSARQKVLEEAAIVVRGEHRWRRARAFGTDRHEIRAPTQLAFVGHICATPAPVLSDNAGLKGVVINLCHIAILRSRSTRSGDILHIRRGMPYTRTKSSRSNRDMIISHMCYSLKIVKAAMARKIKDSG